MPDSKNRSASSLAGTLSRVRTRKNELDAYSGTTKKPSPAEELVNAVKKLSKYVDKGRVNTGNVNEVNQILQSALSVMLKESGNGVQTQKGGENESSIDGLYSKEIDVPDNYYGTYRRPVYNVSKVNDKGVYEYDKQFQKDVQDYIKSISPKMALMELNALQSLVPFMIADPMCRRLDSPVKYGYADLLRFMGWNYDESYVSQVPTVNGEPNPLYAEIKYVFPDTYGNMVLSNMHNGRDMKILIHELYMKLNKINSDYLKNPKKYSNKRSKVYAEIINTLERIVLRKYDPSYLSRTIKGQERPMHKHKMDSFVRDLMLFNSILTRHSGTDPLRHPKETGSMKIVDKHFKSN